MSEQRDVFPFGSKVYAADVKATGSKAGGRFEALVSVFGNVDSWGDRMIKGAFEDTLQAPPEGRGFPPVVWSHLWGIVPIGASMQAEEVEGIDTPAGKKDGLFIDGQLLVDEHQTAKEVYAAMRAKGGDGLPPLREFSFGYRAKVSKDYSSDEAEEIGMPGLLRDLEKVDLYEVGPTLVGANDQTTLLGVKAQLELEKGRMSADLFEELKVWLEERLEFYAGDRERKTDLPTSGNQEEVARLMADFPASRSV